MFKLIVRFESKVIQELELDPSREYLAGRDENCQIPLKGKSGISRQHFKVYFNGSQWQVDVISKFGHLNYQAQEVNTIILESGNSFSLAPFDFQFIEEKPVAVPPLSVTDSPLENPPAPLENDTLAIDNGDNRLPATSGPKNLPASQEDFLGDDEKTSVGLSLGEPIIQISNLQGENLGSFHLREGALWIAGRDEACDIKIPDKKASRKHFEISKSHSGFVVTDLGSSNGTRLNGRKISPNSSLALNSGDVINVASINVRFEIKNTVVEEQIKNLPDVLFNQTVVATPNYTPAVVDNNQSYVEPIEQMDYSSERPSGLQLNPRSLLIGAVVLFLLYILTSEVKDSSGGEKPGNSVTIDDRPINKLTPEQQQMIKESYASAQSLKQKGSYELALSELDKIHKLLPYYEQSKELEADCKSGLFAISEQQRIDLENKKERELAEYIAKVVEVCKGRFNANTSLNDINSCLAPAIERDPENSEIVALQQKATQQDDAKLLVAQQNKEMEDRRRQGLMAFDKARTLQQRQELTAALRAYQQYLQANYPDQQSNRKVASEQVATLQRTIVQKIDELLKQAQDLSGKEDFKGAILAVFAAKKVDPNESRIKEVEDKILSAQNKRLLLLYQDAKFEESLGNVQVTKEKCQKIMELSLPENDFHVKCKKILSKYGG